MKKIVFIVTITLALAAWVIVTIKTIFFILFLCLFHVFYSLVKFPLTVHYKLILSVKLIFKILAIKNPGLELGFSQIAL